MNGHCAWLIRGHDAHLLAVVVGHCLRFEVALVLFREFLLFNTLSKLFLGDYVSAERGQVEPLGNRQLTRVFDGLELNSGEVWHLTRLNLSERRS